MLVADLRCALGFDCALHRFVHFQQSNILHIDMGAIVGFDLGPYVDPQIAVGTDQGPFAAGNEFPLSLSPVIVPPLRP